MDTNISDFLVIGSGIAGLSYALKVAENFPEKSVTIVTKQIASESNTKYAQGGLAVVLDGNDSFEKHVNDTLRAGDGLCDKDVVDLVVSQGPKCLDELLSWGVDFDHKHPKIYDLGKEGGHSINRIVHHKDITGLEIERSLLKNVGDKDNITVLSNHFVLDLISEKDLIGNSCSDFKGCFGAYILDKRVGVVNKYISKITLLATGGAGQVYSNTTNSEVATGDGVAMAYQINADIMDMEFIQFHPTVLYNDKSSFLISEALRGFGAKLRTIDGKFFMHKYDSREELASRDIVSRAINSELQIRGDDYVLLDCRHLNRDKFKKKFPTILEKCMSFGVNAFNEMIPVFPAAHYMCGGISVNNWGQTSINNLFACGECARTGLHGANRLASNSLLEALVFADRCFLKSSDDIINSVSLAFKVKEFNANISFGIVNQDFIDNTKKSIRSLMWANVGIVRTDNDLKKAKQKVNVIYTEVMNKCNKHSISAELIELRNLVINARLIIQHSLKRKINKGVFYNLNIS